MFDRSQMQWTYTRCDYVTTLSFDSAPLSEDTYYCCLVLLFIADPSLAINTSDNPHNTARLRKCRLTKATSNKRGICHAPSLRIFENVKLDQAANIALLKLGTNNV